LKSKLTTEFDQIASAAWQEQQTKLEEFWTKMVGQYWEPDPPGTYYRIWDDCGAFECDICEREDRWQLEGLESQRRATVFVCDHGHQVCGPGWAMRKVRSIPVERVKYSEVVETPLE
jgi:hypothetical protein